MATPSNTTNASAAHDGAARGITQDDIDKSYELGALLLLCRSSLKEMALAENWAVELSLEMAELKWNETHQFIEMAHRRSDKAA